MKNGLDSVLKYENKIHMQFTQDQNEVNMQWLDDQDKVNRKWVWTQGDITMQCLRDQMQAHTKGDAESIEEDGGELTPTSTVMSG